MFQKIIDILRITPTNRSLLLIFGLLVMMLAGSCGGDGDSPTSPDPTSVVIVDKHNANATSPPCGTTDAVCGSITDGLTSAALLQVAIPTVLVKPGTYDAEPTYPLHIHIPVILKSEKNRGATINSDDPFHYLFRCHDRRIYHSCR
jgi:hypothetical protein